MDISNDECAAGSSVSASVTSSRYSADSSTSRCSVSNHERGTNCFVPPNTKRVQQNPPSHGFSQDDNNPSLEHQQSDSFSHILHGALQLEQQQPEISQVMAEIFASNIVSQQSLSKSQIMVCDSSNGRNSNIDSKECGTLGGIDLPDNLFAPWTEANVTDGVPISRKRTRKSRSVGQPKMRSPLLIYSNDDTQDVMPSCERPNGNISRNRQQRREREMQQRKVTSVKSKLKRQTRKRNNDGNVDNSDSSYSSIRCSDEIHIRKLGDGENIKTAINNNMCLNKRNKTFLLSAGLRLLDKCNDHSAIRFLEPLIRSLSNPQTHPVFLIFRVADLLFERSAFLRYSLLRVQFYQSSLGCLPTLAIEEVCWRALNVLIQRGQGMQIAKFMESDRRLSETTKSPFVALALFADFCETLDNVERLTVIRQLIDDGIMNSARRSMVPPTPLLRLFLFMNQTEQLKCRATLIDFLRYDSDSRHACLEFAVLLQQRRVAQVIGLNDPCERKRYLKDDLQRLFDRSLGYISSSKGELGALLIVLDGWEFLDYRTRVGVLKCYIDASPIVDEFVWRLLLYELFIPLKVHSYVADVFPSTPTHPDTRVRLSFDSTSRRILHRLLFDSNVTLLTSSSFPPAARVFALLCSSAFDSVTLSNFQLLAYKISQSYNPRRRLLRNDVHLSIEKLYIEQTRMRCHYPIVKTNHLENKQNSAVESNEVVFQPCPPIVDGGLVYETQVIDSISDEPIDLVCRVKMNFMESTRNAKRRLQTSARMCRSFYRAAAKLHWNRRARHSDDVEYNQNLKSDTANHNARTTNIAETIGNNASVTGDTDIVNVGGEGIKATIPDRRVRSRGRLDSVCGGIIRSTNKGGNLKSYNWNTYSSEDMDCENVNQPLPVSDCVKIDIECNQSTCVENGIVQTVKTENTAQQQHSAVVCDIGVLETENMAQQQHSAAVCDIGVLETENMVQQQHSAAVCDIGVLETENMAQQQHTSDADVHATGMKVHGTDVNPSNSYYSTSKLSSTESMNTRCLIIVLDNASTEDGIENEELQWITSINANNGLSGLNNYGSKVIDRIYLPINDDASGLDYIELFSVLLSSLASSELPDIDAVFGGLEDQQFEECNDMSHKGEGEMVLSDDGGKDVVFYKGKKEDLKREDGQDAEEDDSEWEWRYVEVTDDDIGDVVHEEEEQSLEEKEVLDDSI